MNLTETPAMLIALVAGFVTGLVQTLSGIDLGDAIYNAVTVSISCLSVLSGAVLIARSVGDVTMRRKSLLGGDLWTSAASLAVFTTGLSAYHFILMLYWAVSSAEGFRTEDVEAAFRNWHILAALGFTLLHLFLFHVMKVLPTPKPDDVE